MYYSLYKELFSSWRIQTNVRPLNDSLNLMNAAGELQEQVKMCRLRQPVGRGKKREETRRSERLL